MVVHPAVVEDLLLFLILRLLRHLLVRPLSCLLPRLLHYFLRLL
jgi:hypothetical protein